MYYQKYTIQFKMTWFIVYFKKTIYTNMHNTKTTPVDCYLQS